MDDLQRSEDRLDDASLLRAWCDGNSSAGDRLFDQHFPSLLRFFKNKAPDGFEDLIQETMLECLKSALSFRAESSFRTFMFSIAHHVLMRSYRERARARTDNVDLELLSVEDLQRSPSSVLGDVQQHRLLLRALRRIPLAAQVVLELKYWEGLSSVEIAEVLGISPGTVRMRQLSARERLHEEIERLSESPELAASTIHGFDTWIARVRDALIAP
jgi:RNA polymerase sigma factor (sigma-70 family)